MTGRERPAEASRAPGPPGLDAYLARLEGALAPLPAAERQEILLETRSHVVEQLRRAPDRGAADVLAELGPPEAYARQFLPEPDEPRPGPPAGTLHRLARLATGGLRTIPLLFLVVSAYAVALFAFLLALNKLLEPEATGLFFELRGKRGVMFVLSDPNHGGRDVLGFWLVPLALLVSLAIHLAMSALLRRVLRTDARRSS
jgi:uncharacterized membrane protein